MPEVKTCATPPIEIDAEKGPVPFPSSRRSNFWPAKNREWLGGISLTLLGSAAARPLLKPAPKTTQTKETRRLLDRCICFSLVNTAVECKRYVCSPSRRCLLCV